MSIAKIAVLLIAAIAAIAAAFLVRGISSGQEVTSSVTIEPTIISEPVELILVASSDIEVGQRISTSHLEWTEWPKKAMNKSYLTQEDNPKAIEDYAGAIARVKLMSNEPVTSRKLINSGNAGFMAAVLSPGMRAVSVEISEETGAGGFILPNDKVDIILTRELDIIENNVVKTVFTSQTVFENVRVLAIDQTYREIDDEQVVLGSTATLELNGPDAELLARADASGDLSLALRSISDAGINAQGSSRSTGFNSAAQSQIKVYKYGVASQVGTQ
ncbi:MAG: Flp pilus assembly protein CpaB [Robiginitomaculum sp.]|nr:Flp pilus assembly protein CpaB [Robiginitomaculum sp.]